ncbi:Lrp/AsnC family transcriptional regulator [Motiliproteus sp. MSK22-1]|uniref:Lrp/AsnC family transcriptional regulator n=1 Tax=Motiliproteus sp. MSK22-1 TaxID=1897630 RepID=UPI0009762FDE|nr:Lrp/AsnC family transcriptional regulator [Motiliproteus sp. MSK22-1]OMH27127.1 AsnC family transcriptional regulator [Motiliproteus sp. MSK22-1]
MDLDRVDTEILNALQQNGRLSNRDLADKVSLSNAPCWRRVKRLEQEGYIRGYAAIIDSDKIGLKMCAFAEVSLDNHHPDTVAGFLEMVNRCPEILECHAVSGGCDYLLKVLSRDMESYQEFLSHNVLNQKGVRTANTLFSMKRQKVSVEIPVKY